MNAAQRSLRRRQIDAQLAPLAPLAKVPVPRGGWIRAIREALGMSMDHFAHRLGLSSSSTVFQLEKGEVEETITLKRLRAAADALGCDLVVALVPRMSLERYVREQAARKAVDKLERVSHSMDMESQAVSQAELDEMTRQVTDDILRRSGGHLWG